MCSWPCLDKRLADLIGGCCEQTGCNSIGSAKIARALEPYRARPERPNVQMEDQTLGLPGLSSGVRPRRNDPIGLGAVGESTQLELRGRMGQRPPARCIRDELVGTVVVAEGDLHGTTDLPVEDPRHSR